MKSNVGLKKENTIKIKYQRKLIQHNFQNDCGENEEMIKKMHPLVKLSAVLMLLFFPAAFIVAIVALKKIKAEPEKYKGEELALFVLIFSGFLIFIIFIIFALALFIFLYIHVASS